MSRSRKKISHSTWCVVNHSAQKKHYTEVRRRYRRVSKQHLKNNWHDEDLIMPSHLPYYDPWYAPADGGYVDFYPPEFPNPYRWTNVLYRKQLNEVQLWVDAFQIYIEVLENYERNFRK